MNILIISWNTKDGNFCGNCKINYNGKRPSKAEILKKVSEITNRPIKTLEIEVIE